MEPVGFKPHAVPQPVGKGMGHACLFKNAVGQGIGIAQGHAGAHVFNGCCLRLTGKVKCTAKLGSGGGIAYPEGTGLVRAVIVHAAAHIHKHGAVGGNGIVAGDGVGRAAFLPTATILAKASSEAPFSRKTS